MKWKFKKSSFFCYNLFIKIIKDKKMQDIRWQQRFSNFEKAYLLLKEALAKDSLSDLEKEGAIQRFEYTFELAWKTLKDYMAERGIVVNFPTEVIKEGFKFEVIKEGEKWIEMLKARNTTVHEYNQDKFNEIFNNIAHKYITALSELYMFFKEKI
jgi:nucleotidyltransferase substrate binding protein (TIGR01987 family)